MDNIEQFNFLENNMELDTFCLNNGLNDTNTYFFLPCSERVNDNFIDTINPLLPFNINPSPSFSPFELFSPPSDSVWQMT
jgi:hypothetical protein